MKIPTPTPNGDGIANLTGTNGLTANVTGFKNNFVTLVRLLSSLANLTFSVFI
ncbi:Hep/Hag repeat protein, partial [human gut metagenome]